MSAAVTAPVGPQRLGQQLAPSVAGRTFAVAGERSAAGHRLEAADVAAATEDRRVVGDLDVADVTGRALCAAMEEPVADQPGADARADLDEDDVAVAPRRSRPATRQGP